MDGFWDGVQYYNAKHHTNVKVLGWNEKTQNGSFTGNFTDLTAGQRLTNTFISEGADVIFPVAGERRPRRGQGGPERGHRGRHPEGEHDVGGHRRLRQRRPVLQVLHHQREQGHPTAVKDAVLTAAKGTFKGGNYIGTLANGGVGLAPVPRLRQQGPGLADSPSCDDQDGHRERDDQAGHQEPGVVGCPAGRRLSPAPAGQIRVGQDP